MEALNTSLYAQYLQSDYFRSLQRQIFVYFCNAFILKHKKGKYNYLYRSTVSYFLKFQEYTGETYYTNDIGKELLDEFVNYLHSVRKLCFSTIQGIILRTKYLIRKAYENGWKINTSYSECKIRINDSFFIYLTERDISRIYYFKGLTKRQEEIRDLFIIACKTGLRYSDCSRITKDNIRNGNICILTQKTKVNVCIPMTAYVKEIFKKYNYNLPKPCCIQYYNKMLKEIGKKVGMSDIITYEQEQAGNIITIKKPVYMCMSSHLARRTFITNMLNNDVPESKVQKLTGHKTKCSIIRYNRITLEQNALSVAGRGYLS